jgi:hypothetical protein
MSSMLYTKYIRLIKSREVEHVGRMRVDKWAQNFNQKFGRRGHLGYSGVDGRVC